MNGTQTTPCPTLMVLVRAATQVRKISGAEDGPRLGPALGAAVPYC
ncbi:hypothetical protein [Streptomyces huasconensis]|nr:hypothetical protein [Streptomyces huasconensis]